MNTKLNRICRRMAPLMGAGVLLQANGCDVTASGLAEGLVTSILNNLIASLVFGLFNVPF